MVGLATSALVLLELQDQVGEGGLLQAVKGSAAGPSIAELWNVSGLLLANFSCGIESFGRIALPGVFSIVLIFFLSLALAFVFVTG